MNAGDTAIAAEARRRSNQRLGLGLAGFALLMFMTFVLRQWLASGS